MAAVSSASSGMSSSAVPRSSARASASASRSSSAVGSSSSRCITGRLLFHPFAVAGALPLSPKGAQRPQQEHIEGPELHLERLGTILARALLDETQLDREPIARIDGGERRRDARPEALRVRRVLGRAVWPSRVALAQRRHQPLEVDQRPTRSTLHAVEVRGLVDRDLREPVPEAHALVLETIEALEQRAEGLR